MVLRRLGMGTLQSVAYCCLGSLGRQHTIDGGDPIPSRAAMSLAFRPSGGRAPLVADPRPSISRNDSLPETSDIASPILPLCAAKLAFALCFARQSYCASS
jgi:hypothetical protein